MDDERQKRRRHDNVLHIALRDKVPVNEISKLIETYPDAVKEQNEMGKYPLDCAIEHGNFYTKVFSKLIDVSKPVIQTKNKVYGGGYLLHDECLYDYGEHFVLTLITDFPLAVKQSDDRGRYPLHIACASWFQSEKVILTLLDLFPDAAAIKDSDGFYPLQRLCETEKYKLDNIFLALFNTFPNAAKVKDKTGSYPLNYACKYIQSEEIVLSVISEFPQAANETNNGDYPLYLACTCSQSEKVVLKLIDELSPAAEESRNFYFHCPFLTVFQNHQSEKVLLTLINAFPEAARVKDTSGQYPLHMACNYNWPEEIVFRLLKLFIQAVQEKDAEGWYPLHYAIINHHSENVIFKLLAKFPQAAMDKTIIVVDRDFMLQFSDMFQDDGILQDDKMFKQNFQSFPLHSAIINGRSEKVVLRILNAFPHAANIYSIDEKCSGSDYDDPYRGFPLHLAIKYHHSEKVILTFNNLYLLQGNYSAYLWNEVLFVAEDNRQIPTIVKLIDDIIKQTTYDGSQSCIDIPKIVTIHGLDNLRRHETFQWLLYK